MSIYRNGEQFEYTNVSRKGDLVELTVGCEKVAIDMSTLFLLSNVKEEPKITGFWYVTQRDLTTRKIMYISSPGVRVESKDGKIGVYDAKDKWISGLSRPAAYIPEGSSHIWNVEFFPTPPQEGDV